MAGTIKIRTQPVAGYTELKVLLTHPMENGRNRDPVSGELIPAHFIQQLRISLNDQSLISVDMGGSMAMNPFFSFRLKNAGRGDRVSVSWLDNLGQSDLAEHLIE